MNLDTDQTVHPLISPSLQLAGPPRAVVIDDDPGVRGVISELLTSVSVEVEAYEGVADFKLRYQRRRPECLVIDMRLSDGLGLEIQAELRKRGLDPPTFFISGCADLSLAIRAMKCGALDFLEKPTSPESILAAVRFAILEDARQSLEGEKVSALDTLTPREWEVLEYVIDGQPSKRIAFELSISTRTVELHRFHIMKKTDAGSVAELVRLVLVSRGGIQGNGERAMGAAHEQPALALSKAATQRPIGVR